MKIRWKMLIVISVALIIFMSTMLIVITSILNSSYRDMEENDCSVQLAQAMNAFEMERTVLSSIVIDYAIWDDIYNYIETQDPTFIEVNFADATFDNFCFSDVAIVSVDGDVIYSAHHQEDHLIDKPLPSLIANLTYGGELFEKMQGSLSVNGFIEVGDEVAIFSARWVFHSDTSGPTNGFLFFAVILDEELVDSITEPTTFEVHATKFDAGQMSGQLGQDNVDSLISMGELFIPETDDVMNLYGLALDYRGDPILVISTPMDRQVHSQGTTTMEFTLVSFAITVLILLVIIMILMEGVVVRRISDLDRDVDTIDRQSDPSKRIDFSGNDEIATLAGSINNMLGHLEQTQRTLRESELRHRAILRDQTDMIFRFDHKNAISFANESTCSFIGIKCSEVIGKPFLDRIYPEDLIKLDLIMGSMNQPEASSYLELRIYNSIHNLHWHQWTMRPIYDETGVICEFQVVARDITQQKLADEELLRYREDLEGMVKERTAELMSVNDALEREIEKRRTFEEKLKESQRRYQAVVEDQTELIVRMTPDGSINFVNAAYRKYYGLTEKNVNGGMFHQNIVDEDIDQYRTFLANLDKDRPMGMIEYRVLLDEEIHWQQWTYRQIFDSEGALSEIQGVGRDITQQKRFEEELTRSENLESLGMLAGGMAHEFNNILTTVLGNITLAKTLVSPQDPLHARLESTERSIYEAKKLTDGILTFSDGGEPIKEIIKTADILHQSGNASTMGSQVKIQYNLDENLWNVIADKSQIGQALRAIMTNAVESMPKSGTVKVNAVNVAHYEMNKELDLDAGRYVRIDVVDYGTGIPKKQLGHIFDPYFSTKGSGGLGLTAALSIVKRHHGNIAVESAVDVGSKFTIYLPATDRAPETEVNVDNPDISGKERILLMDDEEGILEVGSELLQEHGFVVDCAVNGEEALANYRQAKALGKPYDLVVMDLTIKGGMGGKETIKELLAFDPAAKAIVSSGYSNDPVMGHFETYGFKGVVKKPYMISELIREIRLVLDREKGSKGL